MNEIAEVRGCHSVLFLECRKQDGYLWLGRTSHANDDPPPFGDDDDGGGGGGRRRLMIGGGPSVRFHVANVHTMDELKMTGNCMKGSRPILSFDSAFDSVDHLKLIKHLFVDVFGTPRGHPKSKPFVDRVMGFYYADGKVRVANVNVNMHSIRAAFAAWGLGCGRIDLGDAQDLLCIGATAHTRPTMAGGPALLRGLPPAWVCR